MKRVEASAPRGILRQRVAQGPRAGDTEHRRILPTAALSDWVAHFWWVRWDLPEPFVTETLPHPSVHVTFELQAGQPARAEVGGVGRARFVRTLFGSGHVFGIKFRPAAFKPFWPGSAADLCDRRVSSEQVLGGPGRRLARAMAEAQGFEACIELAEAYLMPRLSGTKLPSAVADTRDLVERMATDPELLRVEQVAASVGLELRALQRRFRQLVGVSPKWVLMRYRLLEAVERLKSPAPPSLAALAAELGYTDQAHFARDFKAVIGRTMGEFVRQQALTSGTRAATNGSGENK